MAIGKMFGLKTGFVLMLTIGSFAPRSWAGPCDADVEQYCGDVQSGMGAMALCLQQNQDKFSFECRERLKKLDSVVRRLSTACSSDARTYCRDVKPGFGRVKSCMMSNLDKLSPGCRDALQQPVPN